VTIVPSDGFLFVCTRFRGSALVLQTLANKVGAARKKFEVKYPKMYAEGDSEEAEAFNNVQRGHQHALETYTQFVVMSLVSGIHFPLTTALSGLLHCKARLEWAKGYEKSADTRYTHSRWASHIWTSLIVVLGGTVWTAVSIVIL